MICHQKFSCYKIAVLFEIQRLPKILVLTISICQTQEIIVVHRLQEVSNRPAHHPGGQRVHPVAGGVAPEAQGPAPQREAAVHRAPCWRPSGRAGAVDQSTDAGRAAVPKGGL